MTESSQPLLSLRLSVHYPRKASVLRDVAFDIAPAEILGLVGQSGSGKSSLALAMMGLLEMKKGRADGNIDFAGSDLLRLCEREMRRIRGRSLGLVRSVR